MYREQVEEYLDYREKDGYDKNLVKLFDENDLAFTDHALVIISFHTGF